jgi:SagB-type dehydrogenase family enzyme
MDRRAFLQLTAVAAALVAVPATRRAGSAQEPKPIPLPPPQMDGGKPLMQALKDRRSSRNFSSEKLPLPVLGSLLWAGFGVNRPESGGRTAPSASNSQEMDVYVAMADGLFLYDAKAHALQPILSQDIRALTSRQAFAAEVPANLIYVSDLSKMTRASAADREVYAAAHTGFISQNVYLYCASEGLATVVRASLDRPALAKAMGLRADQRITLVQSVGYPKQ